MRKVLVILGTKNFTWNYTEYWNYLRSLDHQYMHFIEGCILLNTDVPIEDITKELRTGNYLKKNDTFVIIDVTDSPHE